MGSWNAFARVTGEILKYKVSCLRRIRHRARVLFDGKKFFDVQILVVLWGEESIFCLLDERRQLKFDLVKSLLDTRSPDIDLTTGNDRSCVRITELTLVLRSPSDQRGRILRSQNSLLIQELLQLVELISFGISLVQDGRLIQIETTWILKSSFLAR